MVFGIREGDLYRAIPKKPVALPAWLLPVFFQGDWLARISGQDEASAGERHTSS